MTVVVGQVTGSLYFWRDYEAAAQATWSVPDHVKRIDIRPPGWCVLELMSKASLLGGDQPGLTEYRYPFMLRTSGSHLLLVGREHELIDALIRTLNYTAYVAPPLVDVAALASELSTNPGEYCLSVMWARTDGYGESLRTLALFGSDLAEARLFVELLGISRPFRVTLRHVRSGSDILSISAGGAISFVCRDTGSLRHVERCLAYLNKRGLVSWPPSTGSADDQPSQQP